MHWEDVCSVPATAIGEEGRASFREDGYLVLPALLDASQLQPLRDGSVSYTHLRAHETLR